MVRGIIYLVPELLCNKPGTKLSEFTDKKARIKQVCRELGTQLT